MVEESAKLHEKGKGKTRGQGGLELQYLIGLILYSMRDPDDWDIIVILNDKEKIRHKRQNQIIIFLKDEHFTIAIHEAQRLELVYFNSYGCMSSDEDEERFDRDMHQLRVFAKEISPEDNIKLKANFLNAW